VIVAHNRSSTSFKAAPKVVVVVMLLLLMMMMMLLLMMMMMVMVVPRILKLCKVPPELRGALEFSPKMGFVQGGESFSFQIKFEPTQQLLQQCKK
jgi:hypothetical protein